MQKPKGKTYGTMEAARAGVESGLSEAGRFKPEASGPKINETSQRPSRLTTGTGASGK
jgi:hypothetical protein